MKISSSQIYIYNHYPCSINKDKSQSVSFGIANSGKLKELFTYSLPCMYTGVDMIDPKKVQRLLNQNAFEGKASEVLKAMKPFEKSITDIEAQAYEVIKDVAQKFPEKNLQQILKTVVPKYKSELKQEQLPILEKLLEKSVLLEEDEQHQFRQFIEKVEDKINEKPIFTPFSSYDFKYKLNKINGDIIQNGSPKAGRVMKKLITEAAALPNETNPQNLEQQKNIIKFLKIILKSSILKKNEQLKTLLYEAEKRLEKKKYVMPFSRMNFLYDLTNLIEPINDQKLKQEILEIAKEMPTSKKSLPAYIMKFSREPSWKIAYRILWPNLASVEHILPQSKGGKDDLYNFGGAGARVNAERGNIDFTEQIKRVPKTAINCQKYVDKLITLLKSGVFDKVKISSIYIDNFARTINEQSQGQVILNTSELQEHRYKGAMLNNIFDALKKK